jgi:hypothetical protein
VIIFIAEDRAYRAWIARHRDGFVLDWRRQPTRRMPTIHRANCPLIHAARPTRSHWTTGRRLKACSLTIEELVNWAVEESPRGYEYCIQCTPQDQKSSNTPSPVRRLTRLGKEILEYILEVTVIHLDRQDSDYQVTVGDLAECFLKTPKQILPVLLRMSDAGYVQIEASTTNSGLSSRRLRVLPTPSALRMLPAYANVPDSQVACDIDRLSSQRR